MFKPINDFIVVEVPKIEKSKGGIVLPDGVRVSNKELPFFTVVASESKKIKKGERAVMLLDAGMPFEDENGTTFVIISDNNIYGVK